jgi:hypothetical protein
MNKQRPSRAFHGDIIMITPTPGRVVWYYPSQHERTCEVTNAADHLPAGDAPLAAHIAYVHSNALVNLMVIDANGFPHGRTSVLLVQTDQVGQQGGSYCAWMPYQLGQAAKTEALQALQGGAPNPAPAPQATTTQAPPIAPTDPAPLPPAVAPVATVAAPLQAGNAPVVDDSGVQQSPNANG